MRSLLALLALTAVAALAQQTYTPGAQGYTLTYQLEGDELVFDVKASVTGTVSVGWSAGGGHQQMDSITGWVTDGTTVVIDEYSEATSQPGDDTANGGQQDATAVEGTEVDGVTNIKFRRKLVTGDDQDVDITQGAALQVIWQTTDEDGTAAAGGTYTYPYHGATNRGSDPINFFGGGQPLIADVAALLTVIIAALFGTYSAVSWAHRLGKKSAAKDSLMSRPTGPGGYVYDPSGGGAKPYDPMGGGAGFGGGGGGGGYGGARLAAPAGLTGGYDDYTGGSRPMSSRFGGGFGTGMSAGGMPGVDSDAPKRGALKAKSAGSSSTNCLRAVLGYRMPRTDKSFGDVLLGVSFAFLNLLLLVTASGSAAKNLGYLAGANALFTAIPGTRNSLLMFLMGVPFDHAIMFHRWLGRFMMFLATLHLLFYWGVWSESGLDIGVQMFQVTKNLYGTLSWLCGVIVIVFSMGNMRRNKWEVFYNVHFTFIPFYAFLLAHSNKMAFYVWFATALYALDRTLRFLWGLRTAYTVLVRQKPGSVVQVQFEKGTSFLQPRYEVGHYVFVNFPQVSILQWHPYTVSSGPDEIYGEVHIKGLGDHTRKLVAEAGRNNGRLRVRVDGPYGNLRFSYRRFPVVTMVTGGIGVTPLVATLKDIYRTGQLPPGDKAPDSCVQSVYAIWVIKKMEEYSWFEEELEACLEKSEQPGWPDLNLWVYVTRDEPGKAGMMKGRPDVATIFREIGRTHDGQAVITMCCGPQALVNNAWDSVVEQGRAGRAFHFHAETFEF